VASFFTSQDENSASEIIQELGSSYVIVDYDLAVTLLVRGQVTGKFWAVALWAGKESAEYFDVYFVSQENVLVPYLLYYPEYYRSLSTRLYNFDGKAVTPESTLVISYQEEMSQEGKAYKLITGAEQFDSYGEAEAYLESQESGNYRIVGTNPLVSPVLLEALENYRLVHGSDETLDYPEMGEIPIIKIFEYTGDGGGANHR